MKALHVIALILVILGGLNWLSVGLFEYDVVSETFGGATEVGSKIVYIIVGVASIWALSFFGKVTRND
ncbi:DUF378 domain-containing protein [Cohnella sp. CFH 77786]|uniref:DUF378 domain-containing protein n=1 Tax=Cohnella sp. CFH 77786 TaxID=2662265 RepID=UPI001C60F51C|nr:DUF378 domain-containing protein [Cohnella sp. CFH 77786]MBW5448668.1 DUF378 domain-containing protein [Cohnella sp. CFH 77786]